MQRRKLVGTIGLLCYFYSCWATVNHVHKKKAAKECGHIYKLVTNKAHWLDVERYLQEDDWKVVIEWCWLLPPVMVSGSRRLVSACSCLQQLSGEVMGYIDFLANEDDSET